MAIQPEEKTRPIDYKNGGPYNFIEGPYDTTAAAIAAVPIALRTDDSGKAWGLTVKIRTTGGIEEWWWQNDPADVGLVKKQTSGGTDPAIDSRVTTLEGAVPTKVDQTSFDNFLNTTYVNDLDEKAAIGEDVFTYSPGILDISATETVWYYTQSITQQIPSLTANKVITLSGFVDGADSGSLVVHQDSTGGRTLTFSASGLKITYVGGRKSLSTDPFAINLIKVKRIGDIIIVEIIDLVPDTVVIPPPTGTGYAATDIISKLQIDGAVIDEALLTQEYNKESDLIKLNSTFLLLHGAYKQGVVYGFNCVTGAIVTSAFTRASRGHYIASNGFRDIAWQDFPMFEYEDTYYSELNAAISEITAPHTGRILVKDYLPSGYVTDGSVDYTSYIRTALGAGSDIIFPNFDLRIHTPNDAAADMLLVGSNKRLYMEEGGRLICSNISYSTYNMIQMKGKSNIKLYNIVLRGDFLNNNTGKAYTNENGIGFRMGANTNIELHCCVATETWGDGFEMAISGTTTNTLIKSVNCIADNCGRNGFAITDGGEITVINLQAINMKKSNPIAGVDVEINEGSVGRNITFLNPSTGFNLATGIQWNIGRQYLSGELVKDVGLNLIKNHFNTTSVRQVWLEIDVDRSDYTDTIRRNFSGTFAMINPDWNHPIPNTPSTYTGWPTPTTQVDQLGGYRIMWGAINDPMMTWRIHYPTIKIDGVEKTADEMKAFFGTNDTVGVASIGQGTKDIIIQ